MRLCIPGRSTVARTLHGGSNNPLCSTVAAARAFQDAALSGSSVGPWRSTSKGGIPQATENCRAVRGGRAPAVGALSIYLGRLVASRGPRRSTNRRNSTGTGKTNVEFFSAATSTMVDSTRS